MFIPDAATFNSRASALVRSPKGDKGSITIGESPLAPKLCAKALHFRFQQFGRELASCTALSSGFVKPVAAAGRQ
jgi:hypothetical protein